MRYVGYGIKINQGKTTSSRELVRLHSNAVHIETSSIISEVATEFNKTYQPEDGTHIERINHWLAHMPNVLHKVMGIDVPYGSLTFTSRHVDNDPAAYINIMSFMNSLDGKTRLARQPITSANKEIYRPELQWIGGHLVSRLDKHIWFKEVQRRAEQSEIQNGTELCVTGAIKYPSDAEFLRSIDPDAVIVNMIRSNLPLRDLTDPTERQGNQVKADVSMYNNGTVADLLSMTGTFYKDLVDDTVKSMYLADAS